MASLAAIAAAHSRRRARGSLPTPQGPRGILPTPARRPHAGTARRGRPPRGTADRDHLQRLRSSTFRSHTAHRRSTLRATADHPRQVHRPSPGETRGWQREIASRRLRRALATSLTASARLTNSTAHSAVEAMAARLIEPSSTMWVLPHTASQPVRDAHTAAFSDLVLTRSVDTWSRYSDRWVEFRAKLLRELDLPRGALTFPVPAALLRALLSIEARLHENVGRVFCLCSAISLAVKINTGGLDAPTALVLADTRKMIVRRYGTARKQAFPLVLSMVKAIMTQWGAPTSPRNKRVMALYVALAFGCLLRNSSIRRLTRRGIVLAGGADQHRMLFVSETKTHRTWRGDWIVLASNPTGACPVRLLTRHLADFSDGRADAPLIPHFRYDRSIKRCVFDETRALDTKTALRYLRLALTECCGFTSTESLDFGTHSGRVGGRQHAALSGLPGWTIRRMGRWDSVEGSDTYNSSEVALVVLAAASLWEEPHGRAR